MSASSTCKAVLVKAGAFSTKPELVSLLEPFDFEPAYGNEALEKRVLMQKLGWSGAKEAGKFYRVDGPDAHKWYFYVYSNSAPAASSARNKVMAQACRKQVQGDVVLVKSGPAGASYDQTITLDEVADAVLMYSTLNPRQVFAEREGRRAFGGQYAGAPAIFLGDLSTLILQVSTSAGGTSAPRTNNKKKKSKK